MQSPREADMDDLMAVMAEIGAYMHQQKNGAVVPAPSAEVEQEIASAGNAKTAA